MVVGLALASIANAQSVGEYYVNGRTGMDRPEYGSATMPWKTIGYAITRMPPITNPSTWNTLLVEGNQVYSPGTNGEVLPIRPSFNLWIEGTFVGHGVLPVIGINPGGIGILFDPAITYERNPSTMRYLVFEGGAYGMSMGSSGTQRHRPRIQDCKFRGQTSAGARIMHAGSQIGIDPRFFQTVFENAPRGLEVIAGVSGALVYPDVKDCTFVGLTNSGIYLDDTSTSGNVGGSFQANVFRDCNRGVHVRSGPAALTTNFSVRLCTFMDIAREGVYVEIVRPGDPVATVERSSFLRCGTGVSFSGRLSPGPYRLTLSRNFMRACTTAGLSVSLDGNGTCVVDARDNLIEGCPVGADVRAFPGVALTYVSYRDRLLRNGTGASFSTSSINGTITMQSAMVCGNTLRGLAVSGGLPFVAHSLTLADNVTALTASGSTNLDHCIFAGNSTNVSGTAAITYSCFQNISYPGVGNLNQTDPRLLRPLYKLAASSPCIDAGNPAASLPATDYEGDPRASVGRFNGNALPDLGADEFVWSGSARKYGVPGFGYFDFFPEIGSSSTTVAIGGHFAIDLSGAILPVFGNPANYAILTFGARDDSGALPYDLTFLGAAGSLLWNDLHATLGVFPVTPSGTASVTVAIPNEPVLAGQTFTFQWFAYQRSANAVAPIASDGLRVTIGR